MLVQGLIVGCFGWLIGMIGLDPQTGVQRFTFNQLFLWDGFDVISGVLALYALPEMMQLGRGRGRRLSREIAAASAPTGSHPLHVRRSLGRCVGERAALGTDADDLRDGDIHWHDPGSGRRGGRMDVLCLRGLALEGPERFGKGAIEG